MEVTRRTLAISGIDDMATSAADRVQSHENVPISQLMNSDVAVRPSLECWSIGLLAGLEVSLEDVGRSVETLSLEGVVSLDVSIG
jgi:hypothetical protein